ncbi:MAG TPA: hypothetical protein PKB02_17805 [Anaerohalosphaeraceae bacterium]|nr:hypothetical protein [Anaerohalosphaeraceae bacterium]
METLASLLGNGAALVASIAAIKGISAWKREFQGKKKIEIAEEAMILFYQASDAIRRIRSPFGYGNEGKSKISESEKTAFENKVVPQVYVILERYEKEENIFNKISAMRYRFMALFGNDSKVPFESIKSIVYDIFHAAQFYRMNCEIMPDIEDEKERKRLSDEITTYRKTIWNVGGSDIIEPRVKEAIDKLEAICRSVILKS